MSSRAISVVAFALLVAAFAADALTPQALVIAILLDVPIVLAALTQSRRLTASLVIAALAADAGAALINAARDGYAWEPIWIADRALSMLSIVMVGFLSTAVQERAERVGRLAAQEARARREAMFAASSERIRTSLSPDVVIRGIVRESIAALEGDAAFWYPARAGGERLTARAAQAGQVDVVDARPSSEMLSLVHRVGDDGQVSAVTAVDPVGRFVLDGLHARSALAIPVSDRGAAFGVLVVTSGARPFDESLVAAARDFAAIAADALAQAQLFAELAERNEALVERQDVIRDLVYALSHDLRTPLAALATTLRQASEGAYGALPDRYAGVLRDSLISIDDLRRLAETLLLVARFESGDRHVDRDLVDLATASDEAVSELGAMAAARGVTLRALPVAEALVRGPRADLKRAIANLVANALAHTPGGGTVEVHLAVERDAVRLTVADDGYGVPAAARSALFQRFSSASRAGGGTGLGLYIVRRIAQESGGSVSYEPREPRGSAFSLTLPRARA